MGIFMAIGGFIMTVLLIYAAGRSGRLLMSIIGQIFDKLESSWRIG